MIRDLNVANEICPREAVVLQSNIQKLVQESKSAFTVIGHCMGEKSRLYKEQLKKMREISNISTRNALQVIIYVMLLCCRLKGCFRDEGRERRSQHEFNETQISI